MLIVPIIVTCLYSEILFDCIIEGCFELYALNIVRCERKFNFH